MAAIYQVLRRATRNAHVLLSVRMAGPPAGPPDEPQKYSDHFGVPVTFNEDADALVMDRRWLDQPLKAPLQHAQNEARLRVERRLSQEGAERNIVDEVRC